MGPWFLSKKSSLSVSAVALHDFPKLKEEARCAFNKAFEPHDIAGGQFPKFLKSESTATREWLMTALRSNTGQDRICAMAYLINMRPTLCLRYVDTLITLINPAKQRDCFQAIDALYQLWERSLMPKNRTLIQLNCRPFGILSDMTESEKEETLSLWFFEDELKARYLRFIKALERLLMTDTVEGFKRKALSVLSSLVCKSPENRSLILSVLINKLGDRSKVLASCVIHKLRGIAGRYPTLLDALVEEVRSFLFRPNLLERAKYYAISLLSCLELRTDQKKVDDTDLASNAAIKLVKIYAAFFHATVKSEEIPERLATALLAGLSRAAPFIPDDRFSEYVKEVDDIFRLVHTTTFNVSLQALAVLFQISSHRAEIRDRYYQALYRKLRDPSVLQTSRGPTVLHLVYRSMLGDPDADRRAAFAQRLLQICLLHPQPGFIVGVLILLSKVHISKQNLIVNSQVPVQTKPIGTNPPTESSADSNATLTMAKRAVPGDDDDDEEEEDEEHFSDAPDSDTEVNQQVSTDSLSTQTVAASTWYHRRLIESAKRGAKVTGGARGGSRRTAVSKGYDPDAREPLFARAGGYPTWPLILLSSHAHPSVSLLARTLLAGEAVLYTGNPFEDFSTLHFLDRFAYKKPKSGTSKPAKEQGRRQHPPPGRPFQRQVGVKIGSRALPVNSALFRQLAQDRVPADEQFFHKYFKFLEARFGKPKKKRHADEESDQSISDEEFDAYLEKYEKGLIPSAPDDDEEDDIQFDNADLSDQSSEAEEPVNSEDEAVFSAMDGITPASGQTGRRDKSNRRSAKKNRVQQRETDSDEEPDQFEAAMVDLDESDQQEDDADMEDAGEDDSVGDFDDEDGDGDSDSDDDEFASRKSKSHKMDSLFASAEEVGQLYQVQETPRERRQRLWEEKRADDSSHRRGGGRGRRGRGTVASRGRGPSGSKFGKPNKGKFKPGNKKGSRGR